MEICNTGTIPNDSFKSIEIFNNLFTVFHPMVSSYICNKHAFLYEYLIYSFELNNLILLRCKLSLTPFARGLNTWRFFLARTDNNLSANLILLHGRVQSFNILVSCTIRSISKEYVLFAHEISNHKRNAPVIFLATLQ